MNGRGEIVWSCLPDFDSPSVFAKLLDEKKGGELAIVPDADAVFDQSYIPNTNVLQTIVSTTAGKFRIMDFMPIYAINQATHNQAPEIYRLVNIIEGRPVVRIRYRPRLNYAAVPMRSDVFPDYIKSYTTGGEYHSIYFYSNLPAAAIIEEQPIALEKDSFVCVSYHQKLSLIDLNHVITEFERTKTYWMNWAGRTQVYARYGEQIIRSALILKLLTYRKTGAVIAAVTTSLPESPGESRNWDYRYCWIRDASMTIQTLWELRHNKTARGFLRFLLDLIIRKADTLQIMYGIRGERDLPEKQLGHLKGFRNSRPVRIGNQAYRQRQNDVYGILMDLIYESFLHFPTSMHESEELWTTVRYIMNTVRETWRKPDRGIWELRTRKMHFVFSKVLSWVAVDRGVRLAELLGRREFLEPWIKMRDEIRKNIEAKAWSVKKRAYTQAYGTEDLDASILLLEDTGYCHARDERYVSSVRSIYEELCRDGLMYRYKNRDDFGKPKTAFTVCSFWMASSLYKIGDKDKAVALFEKLLSHANHLGLFSEGLDFETKEMRGNFPQGYSHLALINTAVLLNDSKPKDTLRFISP